jgi:hypothetical protein
MMKKKGCGLVVALALFAGACLASDYEQLSVGKLYVNRVVISNVALTATAAQLNTASTIGITNASLTITRQAVPSVTNALAQTATLTYLSATGVTSTVVVVTGIVSQAASVAAVTNVVITTQHP